MREGLIRAEDSYRESLQINSNDWDAKYNYEYVDKMQKDPAASVEESIKILEESAAAHRGPSAGAGRITQTHSNHDGA